MRCPFFAPTFRPQFFLYRVQPVEPEKAGRDTDHHRGENAEKDVEESKEQKSCDDAVESHEDQRAGKPFDI